MNKKENQKMDMNKYLGLILIVFFIGCFDTKSKKGLVTSVAKTEKQLMSEVETKKERMKLVEIGNITPTGKFLDQDSIIKTTDDYKGKLLIIDFWATWCSPCLKEAPKFKELEKKYENEKVEFITISVDNQFSYWKNFIKENNWETDNYWFGMNETNPFFSYMYAEEEIDNQNTILIALPRYVIISPNGEIINNKALKPSNPDFEEDVIKLIKEHATN